MYNYKSYSFFKLDWRTVVEREKFADAVIICTPDCLHKVTIYYVICILSICLHNYYQLFFCFFKLFFPPRNLQWLSQRWATTFCWKSPWQWVLCEVHNFNLIMSERTFYDIILFFTVLIQILNHVWYDVIPDTTVIPINAILSTFREKKYNWSKSENPTSLSFMPFCALIHSHDHRRLLRTASRLWRPAPRAAWCYQWVMSFGTILPSTR